MNSINFFTDIPSRLPDGLVTTLLEAGSVRIERTVSHGHATPDGFWFDQDKAKWVIVLKGSARLRFEGDELRIEMKSGDFVNIPAHKRHRVERTTPDEPAIRLAVHYGERQ